MNYIGSKQSLLRAIKTLLERHHINRDGYALDMFAGTCAVAQCLKQLGFSTLTNDWQAFSKSLATAYIMFDTFPFFKALKAHKVWRDLIKHTPGVPVFTYSTRHRHTLVRKLFPLQILRYLNQLPGKNGLFVETYCEHGNAKRLYFSSDNGARIQAIRDQIKEWRDDALITENEEQWLIACLLEAADRVANTASVYGAFLKHVKRSARKPLELIAIHPIRTQKAVDGHEVFCENSLDLASRNPKRLKLVYLDPPYNHRQYASNYHLLETICLWDLDSFTPQGVTGLRPVTSQSSPFCLKKKALEAFNQLFKTIDAEYLLFSYNNEGLLSESDIRELFNRHCKLLEFKKIPYKRFRADRDHQHRTYRGDITEEFLVLGKK